MDKVPTIKISSPPKKVTAPVTASVWFTSVSSMKPCKTLKTNIPPPTIKNIALRIRIGFKLFML